MQLIHRRGWGIFEDEEEAYFHLMGEKGEELGYAKWSNSQVNTISKQEYFYHKYGPYYVEIMNYFQDNITDSCRSLDGSVYVSYYQQSDIHKFDSNGNLEFIHQDIFDTVYGFAVSEDLIWVVYPTRNTIKCYNLKTYKELYSIGDIEGTLFNLPESIYFYDELLYVCDMGNQRICTIDPESKVISSYKEFREPVWEYIRSNNYEIVRLKSGIFRV